MILNIHHNEWLPFTVVLNCVYEMCCLLLIKQCYVNTSSSIELDFMCLLTIYICMYIFRSVYSYNCFDNFYFFIIMQVNKGTVNLKEGFLN